MVAVCNFLGISYKKDDLFLHIFTNLRKGLLLKSVGEAEDDDEDEDDEAEDDEDSNDSNKDAEKDDTRSNASFNRAFSQKSMKTYQKTPNNIIVNECNKNYSAKLSLNFKDIEESYQMFRWKRYFTN